MSRHPRRVSTLALGTLAACMAASGASAEISRAQSRIPQIQGTVTSMNSSVKRMISYRDQNHSWQTADGAIHLVINLGNEPVGKGLALYSSFDNGTTWKQMLTFAYTDGSSTDDGVLTPTSNGATLQLVYSTSPNPGAIKFATLSYSSSGQSWSLTSTQTAFKSPGIIASNPAFGSDSAGNLWCGFTEENPTTLLYWEEMIYQPAGQQQWFDSGTILGAADNTTQHSARPVPIPGGIGVLYEVDEALYWAYWLNGSPFNAPWTTTLLYPNLPPANTDPFDTHYSVVADANDNLYLAFVGAPANLLFTVYSSSAGTWGPIETVESSASSPAYPEISLIGSTLMLMANYETSVEVLQSTNGGQSFTPTAFLTHAPAQSGSGITYGKPRVETPRYPIPPVPTWQQFVDGTTEELLFFQVPLTN